MELSTRTSRRTPSLRNLQKEVSRLFESFFPGTEEGSRPGSAVWAPRMDLMETDGTYHLRVDLPGVAKDDVSITVDDNRLILRGERTNDMREKTENHFRMERMFGTFYRSVRLPRAVDDAKIKATFRDGVLSVDIPKTEKSTPKKIKIS